MKVIVCGGRDYLRYDVLANELTNLLNEYWHGEFNEKPVTIISGGATGADFLTKVWYTCEFRDHPAVTFKEYPANWKAHGKAAGAIRNQQMLEEEGPIDLVIAFPGGRGTADMITRAKKAGVPVYEY